MSKKLNKLKFLNPRVEVNFGVYKGLGIEVIILAKTTPKYFEWLVLKSMYFIPIDDCFDCISTHLAVDAEKDGDLTELSKFYAEWFMRLKGNILYKDKKDLYKYQVHGIVPFDWQYDGTEDWEGAALGYNEPTHCGACDSAPCMCSDP
ncbi:MAG: hypothetical protein HOB78_02665, partial [Flavobacteriales bacterium]|nr:hypothetical protein [Flavobacteriales bacterium]